MQRAKPNANVVLFTGLVRHPEMLEQQLELIKDLDCVNRRVLVTWTDEYEKNEDFLKGLCTRFGLEIVHNGQPPFVRAYFLHQMYALDLGLAQVGDHDLVLKTRADLVIEPRAIAYVLGKDRYIRGPGLHQDLCIDSRIDIVEAQIGLPFMFDDIAFCGVAADLKRVVNMEMKFQIVYRCHSIAQERYFGHLFSARVSFIEDHFRHSWVFGGDDGAAWTRVVGNDYRRRMTEFAMRDRDYATMMAYAYLATAQLFSLDWGGNRDFLSFRGAEYSAARSGPRWGGRSFDHQPTLTSIFSAHENYTQPDGSVGVNGDRFFARVVEGDFQDCAIGRNIRRGLDLVRGASLRELQTLADMRGFATRALAQSRQIVHDLLPRFQQAAHELVAMKEIDTAELLINRLMTHMAA